VGDSNPAVKGKTNNHSRLVGIRRMEVDIASIVHTEDISLDILRMLGTRLKIKSCGLKTKRAMANVLVECRAKIVLDLSHLAIAGQDGVNDNEIVPILVLHGYMWW
jgi:hypothetical protein